MFTITWQNCQVAPLPRGLGREQDRGLFAERGDGSFLIRTRQAAVINRSRDVGRCQVPGHLIQGLPERGED